MKKAIFALIVFVAATFAASVSGRVVNEMGGPYPGLTINLSGDYYYESTTSALSGNFIFTGVSAGSYNLYPDGGTITTPWDYEIYIMSDTDSLTGYDFTVRTPPTPDAYISGVITYSDASPAPYVEVYVWGESSPFSYEQYTDIDGRYSFELAGGDTYYISCWSYGYMSDPDEYSVVLTTGDSLDGFDFVLTPPPPPDASVSGRVIYSDGTPAAWAEIYAYGFSSPFSYNTYTDASGLYTLGLPSGDTYSLYCWSYGSYITVPSEYTVFLSSGDSLTGYDFTFFPDTFPDEMTIEVWVSDEYGNPMSDVRVSFTPDTGGFGAVFYTDDEGYAYYYPYAPGYYTVEPSMEGMVFTPADARVYVDYSDPYNYVSFTGDSGSTIEYGIEILAMDSTLAGVESLFVEWRPLGGIWSLAVTNDSGYAFISLPSAGTYNLRALHPNPLAVIIPCSLNVSVDDTENVAWVIFTVQFLDGIDEASRPKEPGIALSPNPFNSTARISAHGGANIDEIEIFDISGRLVARERYGPKRLTVDWSAPAELHAGVYYFKVYSAGKVFTTKAVFAK